MPNHVPVAVQEAAARLSNKGCLRRWIPTAVALRRSVTGKGTLWVCMLTWQGLAGKTRAILTRSMSLPHVPLGQLQLEVVFAAGFRLAWNTNDASLNPCWCLGSQPQAQTTFGESRGSTGQCPSSSSQSCSQSQWLKTARVWGSCSCRRAGNSPGQSRKRCQSNLQVGSTWFHGPAFALQTNLLNILLERLRSNKGSLKHISSN